MPCVSPEKLQDCSLDQTAPRCQPRTSPGCSHRPRRCRRSPSSGSPTALSCLHAVASQERLSDDGTDRSTISEDTATLLDQLLQDDPRSLDLSQDVLTAPDPQCIKEGLQHRDEARQYGAAVALMEMPRIVRPPLSVNCVRTLAVITAFTTCSPAVAVCLG